MKKINVLLFCIIILGFSLFGLSTNSHYTHMLIDISVPFIYARIAIVAALLTYVFVPSLRLYMTRALVSAGGILMLSTGLISLGSPSLLGYTNTYILLGDSLTLIEAGILAIVISTELSVQKSQFIMKIFDRLQPLFTSSIKDVGHAHMANRANRSTPLAQHLQNHSGVRLAKYKVGTYAVPSKMPA